ALDGDNLILVSWFDGDVRIWDPVNEKRVARYPDLVLPVAGSTAWTGGRMGASTVPDGSQARS
ncbi:MAG: hypothetical protein P8Y95_18530, partial [Gammaproteobacteria bacterium]